MKILIADDDDLAQKILRRYLVQWGHEVVTANNGQEAWVHFQREAVPIVISDWMMPEADGLELIRRIRAHPKGGYVYAILVTARAGKDDLVKGMEAGADDFVAKPFDRDELRVRLREGERIIGLENALSAALTVQRQVTQTRELRLRDLVAKTVEQAEKDLARAASSLSAVGDRSGIVEKITPILEDLSRARSALGALRAEVRPAPAGSV